MTLTINLAEEDYLQSQLFIASKSDRVNKQRKKRWIWVTAAFFVFAVTTYESSDQFLLYYFLIAGLASALFYPKYSAYLYKRHYRKYVADVHKHNFNETIKVNLSDDVIETQDRTGTSKINLAELESISEIACYFYLKLKSGPHLIIPKAQLNNIDDLRNKFLSISNTFNFNFISELNWKWK